MKDATKQVTSTDSFRWWVSGDMNGFFGLFTNLLLNVIVLTGLSLGLVQLPDGIVYGRILPALGIALALGNIFYTWMAYQLAKRERRSDVTAMPYGPSVPHMFIVVFLVMLPVYLERRRILPSRGRRAWLGVSSLESSF
jgi:AGZA family xanthine/uracil permease-like MFS transporter